MREAVIVSAVRSPVGKRGGVFAELHPVELGAQVLNGLVKQAGVDPGVTDLPLLPGVSTVLEPGHA